MQSINYSHLFTGNLSIFTKSCKYVRLKERKHSLREKNTHNALWLTQKDHSTKFAAQWAFLFFESNRYTTHRRVKAHSGRRPSSSICLAVHAVCYLHEPFWSNFDPHTIYTRNTQDCKTDRIRIAPYVVLICSW